MLIPPPLPESWPFEVRNIRREQNFIDGAKLPGLIGRWRIVSTTDRLDFNEAKQLYGLFGRGGLIQSGDCVLRPYHRGGWVRCFNKNKYLRPERFKIEYDVHTALWDAGFPTVEPVGYAHRRHSWGVEGVFITRRADSLPWPSVWESADSENQAAQIALLIKSLSAWGLWAPDLNATNFIVTPNGQILALDWDRAGWTIKRGLLKSYWTRLERSMYKLNASPALIDSLRNNLIGGL
ncbi:MAG: hypothetical protein LBB40_05615 [Holophagales bacterium]|jgi:hypothetical protein|nr:hypothetical protein [Holophagales bacterium]